MADSNISSTAQSSKLTRKFGTTGPYIYNGQQIDMYQLSIWIGRYNRLHQCNLKPSTVTESHIEMFLGWREDELREEALIMGLED